MRARHALAAVATLLVAQEAACASSRDDDAFRLSKELGALGEEIARGMEASPNERGLDVAEALVTQRGPALRELARTVKKGPLGRDGFAAQVAACANIGQSGMIAKDHVLNARRPDLVGRAAALQASLESLCAD